MGFNCAAEKAKFDREWAKLRKEYANAGMSEKSIQKYMSMTGTASAGIVRMNAGQRKCRQ